MCAESADLKAVAADGDGNSPEAELHTAFFEAEDFFDVFYFDSPVSTKNNFGH